MKIGDKVSVIDEDLEGTLVSVKYKTAVLRIRMVFGTNILWLSLFYAET